MTMTPNLRRATSVSFAGELMILALALLGLALLVASSMGGCVEGPAPAGTGFPRVAFGEAGGVGYATVYVEGTRVRVAVDQRAIRLGDETIYCPTVRVEVGVVVVEGAQPGASPACKEALGDVAAMAAPAPAPFPSAAPAAASDNGEPVGAALGGD